MDIICLFWSTLSSSEKELGLSPVNLKNLKFDIPVPDNEMKPFITGCMLAASNKERVELTSVFNQSDSIKQFTSDLVNSTVTEPQIGDGEGMVRPPTFEGIGYGQDYREYRDKFTKTYNSLISSDMSHLLHPARLDELLAVNSDELLAKRLICFRLYGEKRFHLEELKAESAKFSAELEEVNKLLPKFSETNHVEEITSKDLDLVRHKVCRKYIACIFNTLSLQGKLDILKLEESKLYDYTCNGELGGPTHPELIEWARVYMKQISVGDVHFGMVVKHLRHLADGDLNKLNTYCINEDISRINWLINNNNREIEKVTKEIVIKNTPDNYPRGDFSFMNSNLDVRILTNIFNAFEKLDKWSFFDEGIKQKYGYSLLVHPTVDLIASELDSDGHSGSSMSYCFMQMEKLHKIGWESFVNEYLSYYKLNAGMLYRLGNI